MRSIIYLLIICLFNSSIINIYSNTSKDSIIDYRRYGAPYYPQDAKLSVDDSLTYPILYNVSLSITDIKSLDFSKENNSEFFSELFYDISSKYSEEFITSYNDTINLDPRELIEFEALSTKWGNKFEIEYNPKRGYIFSENFKGNLDHRWDMRDFPFDTQELKYTFTTVVDTSIVNISESIKSPSEYDENNDFLQEGYQIASIKSVINYTSTKNDKALFSPGNERPIVLQELTYILEVSRDGFWTYIKYFFGGFLSFLISWFVFLIPPQEFESRTNLAVAAVFGGLGNKYFVEEALPNVMVLTKADIINNLIILLIVFNILIMIKLKKNKAIFPTYINSDREALIKTAIIFIVSNLIVILW